MRKVIVSIQVTLDGFICGPSGEMDWISYDDDEQWKDLFDQLKSVDTIFLGGGMYPEYAHYWQGVNGNPSALRNEIEYARIVEKTPHVVFSTTLENVAWSHTRIVKGNIGDEVTQLKQQSGKNMVLFGGAGIISAFVNLDLVDAYRILVNPVVLGDGKPLFNKVSKRHQLKLVETRTFPSGTVALYYQSQR